MCVFNAVTQTISWKLMFCFQVKADKMFWQVIPVEFRFFYLFGFSSLWSLEVFSRDTDCLLQSQNMLHRLFCVFKLSLGVHVRVHVWPCDRLATWLGCTPPLPNSSRCESMTPFGILESCMAAEPPLVCEWVFACMDEQDL